MRDSSITALAQAVTVEDLETDPYPIYARLRREAPVCYIPAVGLWFVTRYDDVEFAASRPELFTAELDDSPVDRTFGSPTIITVDGQRHLDLRRGLDSKYRPKQVNGYRSGSRSTCCSGGSLAWRSIRRGRRCSAAGSSARPATLMSSWGAESLIRRVP
jgi:cytochrome P450